MAIAQAFPQQPRAFTGIGISLAVHLVLIGLWQLARPVALQEDAPAPRARFLRLLPPRAPERPGPAPPRPAAPAASGVRVPDAERPQPARAAPAASTPETLTVPAAQSADAPTASSTDLLRDAKAAAGAIDRALRADHPRRGIEAPIETAQTKLEKGIARAAELAPNKWYQAPKMEEIIDPGGYGRRRYRVVGAAGTYCVTYESNHAPDGIDSMRNGIKPKITDCEEHEEPAKAQKWN